MVAEQDTDTVAADSRRTPHHLHPHHHHKNNFKLKIVFYSQDHQKLKSKVKTVLDQTLSDKYKAIQTGPMFQGLLLTREIFDMRGNIAGKYWGDPNKTYYTGPLGKKAPYFPAFKWIGYGLKVKDQYENNDWLGHSGAKGEWWNSYQGVRSPGQDIAGQAGLKVAGAIIKSGFIIGKNHEFYQNGIHRKNSGWVDLRDKKEEDLNHPGQLCKWGAYFSPYPDYVQIFAQNHGFGLNGKEDYALAFMVRMNPQTTMIRKLVQSEWLCSGQKSEVRPIRILIIDKNDPNFKKVTLDEIKAIRKKTLTFKTN